MGEIHMNPAWATKENRDILESMRNEILNQMEDLQEAIRYEEEHVRDAEDLLAKCKRDLDSTKRQYKEAKLQLTSHTLMMRHIDSILKSKSST